VARFAVKPTSSILSPRRTVDRKGADTDILTKGRHDPCVGIRAVPVGEAMMACVLADHFLRHRGQVGGEPLDLPQTQVKSLGQDKMPLQLSVDVKGRIFINDTEVALHELTSKLKAITDARRGD
jgi:hypothetical protein